MLGQWNFNMQETRILVLPQMRVNRGWCGQRLQGRRLARASGSAARNDKRRTHTSSKALGSHERPLCGVDTMGGRHVVVDFQFLCLSAHNSSCICYLACWNVMLNAAVSRPAVKSKIQETRY